MGDQGALLTSSKDLHWTIQPAVFPQVVFDIVWAGSQLVVVGRGGSIFTSPSGQKWMAQLSTFQDLYRTAWSGSRLVTVGKEGTILTSP